MRVHLVDGTFELFRAYYGAQPKYSPTGKNVGAAAGLLRSLAILLRQSEVTHVACAFDHVVESFRNRLFPSYKSSRSVPKDLLDQFSLAEEASRSLGIVTWPMVEFEADDALATAALRYSSLPRVNQVVICSPDKDLAQVVDGARIVTFDRIRHIQRDEDSVVERFGVLPSSIPDYLSLVGDSADGLPGIPRWGARSAALMLSNYRTIESIPAEIEHWSVLPRGAETLSKNLNSQLEQALLYKKLSTLIIDVPITETLSDLQWLGVPQTRFERLCTRLGIEAENAPSLKWLQKSL